MKKRIPTILLLISPYLLILIEGIYNKYYYNLTEFPLKIIILIYFIFIAAIFIPNMAYAFVLAKHGESSTSLLFWDMILKLCNIPIYVVIFIYGFIMAIVPPGIVITLLLVIFDYILLLPSSMYGISGLIKANGEGKITTSAAVISIVLHFFFVTDVICAIIMFCTLKEKDKRLTY